MTTSAPGKISLALGGAKKPARAVNGLKRPRAAFHDPEDHAPVHGQIQRVSHFDTSAGGAIDDSRPRVDDRPLVITPQANRDWREASHRNKRQRSTLPVQTRNEQREAEIEAQDEAKKPAFGLNITSRETRDAEALGEDSATAKATVQEQQVVTPDSGSAPTLARTEDEAAMDALLGRAPQQPDMVVPAMTEEEVFERDFHEAPGMSTLDDYARVPVEQFGAALLRGLGWRDGEGIGSDRGKKVQVTKIPQRRPALLGIGAKEEAAVAQELGTWGKAAKDKKGVQQIYNPVLLRDKKTGELFTEEELQKKKEHDERTKYELEFEQSEGRKERDRRNREDSRERDGYRREKDRRRERRDDSRDRDDRHRRRRDDSDEERYHAKKDRERKHRYRDDEQERERDRYERGGRDRDSGRSSRYESDRDGHRDRDRRDRGRTHRR